MDKEPFELIHNKNGQVDIIDWAESENTNQIHIYNDLGILPDSAAPALCELLNEQYKEIQELKTNDNFINVFFKYYNKNKRLRDVSMIADATFIILRKMGKELGVIDHEE